ncbi:MAG: malto-oligosyltrehalose trehalohydrolase [Syntrophobacter sp.]
MSFTIGLGAIQREHSRFRFQVWAPLASGIEVHIVAPQERLLPLWKGDRGYFHAILDDVEPGTLYFYTIDHRKDRPDPASRFQPRGVHGPSQVIGSDFPWEDYSWSGLFLPHYILYELHVGAFTPEGTFDAVIPRLDELKDLGITAIELMPVAQFPGSRNWGYDGTYPFAVHNTYGGPNGLKRLVNACHKKQLAVVLDVVYNHLGPEGNYLGDFGRYFSDRYLTPWGRALNFDGPESDEVRRYFVENALYWVREFHVDALRLDAVHAIVDQSPYAFLAELAETVRNEADRLNRPVYLMAESDLNDNRLLRAREIGGYGLDVHWNDDFHHSLHSVLTGEQTGYYEDFGRIDQLAKAFRDGFVYSGEYSRYRRRRHGSSSSGIHPQHFVVFSQNHDQVGNRYSGDRLSSLVCFEALKLAAGVVLLSPFIPLLFMGEEYAETAPFMYFVSHSDPDLIGSVRKGRAEEFAAFGWTAEPPDPQAEETFQCSKVNPEQRLKGNHKLLREFYRELILIRKGFIALSGMKQTLCYEKDKVLFAQFEGGAKEVAVVFHFGRTEAAATLSWPPGTWRKELDSAQEHWGGQGGKAPLVVSGGEEVSLTLAPLSLALYVHGEEA